MNDIPIVSFAPFLTGSEQDQVQVAKEVYQAFSTVGFIYLTDHGILITIKHIINLHRKCTLLCSPSNYQAQICSPRCPCKSRLHSSRSRRHRRTQRMLRTSSTEHSLSRRRYPPRFPQKCRQLLQTMLRSRNVSPQMSCNHHGTRCEFLHRKDSKRRSSASSSSLSLRDEK